MSRVGIPIGAVRGLLAHGLEGYIAVKHRTNFFTEAFDQRSPDEIRWLDDAYASSAPTVDEYLKHVRARQAHSTVDQLSRISCPTLVVVGTADTADGGTGSHVTSSLELERLIPGARLVTIGGARHGFMWENLEETLAVFDQFLDRVEQDQPSPV
jgi:pimeloyl-ACP methyl ester carboxylesterase